VYLINLRLITAQPPLDAQLIALEHLAMDRRKLAVGMILHVMQAVVLGTLKVVDSIHLHLALYNALMECLTL
jgi:hypothetical protein